MPSLVEVKNQNNNNNDFKPGMAEIGKESDVFYSKKVQDHSGDPEKTSRNGLDVSVRILSDSFSTTSPSTDRTADTKTTVRNGKQGGDRILPSDKLWTWNRTDSVKLRKDTKNLPPRTVMSALRNTAEAFPNHPALAVKTSGCLKKWTFTEYYNDVWRAAKAMISLGLERYNGVGIIGFNSPEWFIADLAAIFAGGFAAGIYATSSSEACKFVAENAKCNIIVVENDHQLQKILQIGSDLPHLKAIIQYKGQPVKGHVHVYSWEEFMQFADQSSDAMLQKIVDEQAVNQCCTLIYTSGTTGNPKGVMLSHDNLTWTAQHAVEQIGLIKGEDILVSYLPLSHVAAQVLDIFIPITTAATVYFAKPDALKGSLGETLRDVRPTIFLGVPRVWEKMQEKMTSLGVRQSHIKRTVANWAKGKGLRGSLAKMNGDNLPFGWTIANQVVFKKVRAALGFDRCRLCLTAAAPITRDTLEFFMSYDINILEIFGLSETSGPQSISTLARFRIPSVGLVNKDSPVVILNKDSEGNGEVASFGRNIFMGYLDEKEKTEETFTPDGYLKSGDIGRIDADGFLYITGRIKELIITAGGENVAPVPIEDAVKSVLPEAVSNCMLVGDKKRFLSMLITLKTEIDPETSEPTDRLSHSTLEWSQKIGSTSKTVPDVIKSSGKDPILSAIQSGIDEANKKAVSRAQIIQKWTVIPKDFSVGGGELGPTLKLKRHVVSNMHHDTIESFYVEKS